MGYSDRFYYGQCIINVATKSSNVSVTDGSRTWKRTGAGEVTVPGKNKYTVTAGTAKKDVYAGYGDYISIEM